MPYGDYTNKLMLGRGSYGQVFLVEHKTTKKLYAIKTVNVVSMTGEEKTKCDEEISIMKELNHPNESYQNQKNNKLQIVMNYCDGTDLYKLIQRYIKIEQFMKEAAVMNYFVQILLGLNYLHSKHVIHRDIKPANIFLLGNGRLVIGDLGVSKLLENTNGRANTTCGTPYYLAPELCKGEDYDNKVDIWSLGVLLYFMVTKDYPFKGGKNIRELNNLIIKGKYEPIAKSTKKVYSEDMENLIKELLQTDPNKRPSTSILLSNSYVKRHLISFFQNIKAKSISRMSDGTINIRNALRDYAKQNGFMVSVDLKMEIPSMYEEYVNQLKNIGLLDDIIKSLWTKGNIEKRVKDKKNKINIEEHRRYIEEQRNKLDIKKQNQGVIKESLAKLRKQKEDIKKRNKERELERYINQKNQKNKKNIDNMNTDLEEISETCFTPTVILDSDIEKPNIDIHNPSNNSSNKYPKEENKKIESGRNDIENNSYDEFDSMENINEIENELNKELSATYKIIKDLEEEVRSNEELLDNEKESEDELFQTCKTISNLNSEIKVSINSDEESESDESENEEDDDKNEESSKVNCLKKRCESIKSKLINEIGFEKYVAVYNYVNILSKKNNDSVPSINNPAIVNGIKSFLNVEDDDYALSCGKKVCDIICMEHF